MAKSHSQRLRVLAEQGHKIVCASGLFEGSEVVFEPTHPINPEGLGQTDRKPWVLKSADGERVIARLAGNECRVAREGE